jgi:2,5-dihydroxypyridine 5,6-dioxygenase
MSGAVMPEWRWVERFAALFEACGLAPGDQAIVVGERRGRDETVTTSRMALEMLGVSSATMRLCSPEPRGRSILGANPAAVAGLGAADLVVDCTRAGLDGESRLADVLSQGARVLRLVREAPTVLASMTVDPPLRYRVSEARRSLGEASALTLSSPAGTALELSLSDAEIVGDPGWTVEPGTHARWPGGRVGAVVDKGAVDGTLALSPCDLVVDPGLMVRSAISLAIEDGRLWAVDGDPADPIVGLLRDREGGTALVHALRWGLNDAARWPMAGRSLPSPHECAVATGVVTITLTWPKPPGRARRFLELAMAGCSVDVDGVEVVGPPEQQGGLGAIEP